jgi:hypothetical protein
MLFQFLRLLWVGEVRRSRLDDGLGTRKAISETLGPVFQRILQGIGTRGQSPLIESHEEAYGAVVPLGSTFGALVLHKMGHVPIQVVLRPVDLKVHKASHDAGPSWRAIWTGRDYRRSLRWWPQLWRCPHSHRAFSTGPKLLPLSVR